MQAVRQARLSQDEEDLRILRLRAQPEAETLHLLQAEEVGLEDQTSYFTGSIVP
jgi:hypothetical protein